MKIRIVSAAKPAIVKLLIELQGETFASDEVLVPTRGQWWIAYDDGEPCGFAALLDVPSWPNSGYMARCGVLHSHRGQGIQRSLLTVRERMARRLGLERIISTTYNNPVSANNLISRGFLTYEPTVRWGADNTIYWVKTL